LSWRPVRISPEPPESALPRAYKATRSCRAWGAGSEWQIHATCYFFLEPLGDLSFLNVLTSSFLLEYQWLFYTSTKLRTLWYTTLCDWPAKKMNNNISISKNYSLPRKKDRQGGLFRCVCFRREKTHWGGSPLCWLLRYLINMAELCIWCEQSVNKRNSSNTGSNFFTKVVKSVEKSFARLNEI
jgi:hypothetical protein